MIERSTEKFKESVENAITEKVKEFVTAEGVEEMLKTTEKAVRLNTSAGVLKESIKELSSRVEILEDRLGDDLLNVTIKNEIAKKFEENGKIVEELKRLVVKQLDLCEKLMKKEPKKEENKIMEEIQEEIQEEKFDVVQLWKEAVESFNSADKVGVLNKFKVYL